MLTIQPNMFNSYSKIPTFGKHFEDAEYTDFEEYTESPDSMTSISKADEFDISTEKQKAKTELDLWEQTKDNLDSIAKTTESVPALRKGTQVLSGLISVAIGWGGLRWGTVGTLEVLSKIGKTSLVKGIKKYMGEVGTWFSNSYKASKKYFANTDLYKNTAKKLGNWKKAALDTSVGRKYTDIKDAVVNNSFYQKAVEKKNNAVDYIKNLNPRRVFVETMGVAGGGTAAINTIGGKAVDGSKHNVEQDIDGNFYIDGRKTDYNERRNYENVA